MAELKTKNDVFNEILSMKMDKNEVYDVAYMNFIIKKCMKLAKKGLKLPDKIKDLSKVPGGE